MTPFRICGLILPAALAALAATNARAQSMFYPTNATINYAVNGNAYVGYANQNDANNGTNKTSPTVSLVTGGSIASNLQVVSSSTVNVTGGSVFNALVAFDSSTVNVSGGSFGGFLIAYDSSTVNVSGVSAGGGLGATGTSRTTITGGTFGKLQGVNFFDGTLGSFTLVGSNLTTTNARPDTTNGGTDYDLSGTLQNGTNLSGYVLGVQTGSTFTLRNIPAAVPEPGSVALLFGMGVTGAGWLVRRRRR